MTVQLRLAAERVMQEALLSIDPEVDDDRLCVSIDCIENLQLALVQERIEETKEDDDDI